MSNKLLIVLLASLLVLSPLVFAAENDSNATNSSNVSANVSANATANATTNTTVTVIPTPKPFTITPEAEAGYYLHDGETLDFIKTTYKGKEYTIAVINGKESLVLDASAKTVTNTATLQEIINNYVSITPLQFNAGNLANVRSQMETYNASFQLCRSDKTPGVYYNLSNGYGGVCYVNGANLPSQNKQCWIIYNFDLGIYAFNTSLASYKRDIQNGTADTANSLNELSTVLEDVDTALASGERLQLAYALLNASARLANMTAAATRFNAGHAFLSNIPEFGSENGGRLKRCNLNTAALASASSEVNAVNNFPNSTVIIESVAAFTKDRADEAGQKRAIGPLKEMMSYYETTYASFAKRFKAINGQDPSFADAALKALRDLKAAADNASSSTIAVSKANAFQSNYDKESKALLAATSALQAYGDSLDALDNATSSLAATVTTYGTSDERVTAMQAESQELQKQFELKEADLKQGRPVTSADFEAIKEAAKALDLRSQTLPRKENIVDLALVAEIIVLVLVVAGAFVLLLKYRVKLRQAAPKEAQIEKLQDKK